MATTEAHLRVLDNQARVAKLDKTAVMEQMLHWACSVWMVQLVRQVTPLTRSTTAICRLARLVDRELAAAAVSQAAGAGQAKEVDKGEHRTMADFVQKAADVCCPDTCSTDS